jgi:hypothetical protein
LAGGCIFGSDQFSVDGVEQVSEAEGKNSRKKPCEKKRLLKKRE